jgi:arylformamidase
MDRFASLAMTGKLANPPIGASRPHGGLAPEPSRAYHRRVQARDLKMTDDPTFQYLIGQRKPGHPELLDAFVRESDAAVAALNPALDLPYGPHPRQRFDWFAAAAPRATFAYFHAGYWQSRDKAHFRFIAPRLVAAGFNVAMVNYPLCPEVELAALTEAVRQFPAVLRARDKSPLIIAGHSAGAHLAVELALSEPTIHAIIALSGVYDLLPLLATSLNDKLRLNPETARAASPVFRARGPLPPALFAVGAEETPAFQSQNEAMRAAWAAAGGPARGLVVEGADHFSLLRDLTTPGSPLLTAIVDRI